MDSRLTSMFSCDVESPGREKGIFPPILIISGWTALHYVGCTFAGWALHKEMQGSMTSRRGWHRTQRAMSACCRGEGRDTGSADTLSEVVGPFWCPGSSWGAEHRRRCLDRLRRSGRPRSLWLDVGALLRPFSLPPPPFFVASTLFGFP
jgi:hypothetical protein